MDKKSVTYPKEGKIQLLLGVRGAKAAALFSIFEMAGYFAAKVNAKKLILTHFSQRYKGVDENVTTKTGDCVSIDKLLRQAEKVFKSDSVIAAGDFLVIYIPRKQE